MRLQAQGTLGSARAGKVSCFFFVSRFFFLPRGAWGGGGGDLAVTDVFRGNLIASNLPLSFDRTIVAIATWRSNRLTTLDIRQLGCRVRSGRLRLGSSRLAQLASKRLATLEYIPHTYSNYIEQQIYTMQG